MMMKRILFLASLLIGLALAFAPIDAPRVIAQTFAGQPSPQYVQIGQGSALPKWLPITGCSLTSPGALSCPIIIGATTITSGTTQQLLYDNGGTLGEITKGNNCLYVTSASGVPSCGNTLLGDFFAGSGRPWIDVRAYCPNHVDGTSDDTACIQNAINAATGGTVLFPLGNYCVKTSGGISVTTAGVWLVGPSNDAGTLLQTCGVDTNLLTINADSVHVENMSLLGAGLSVSANHNVITIGSSCVRCRLFNLDIAGGYYNIANVAPYVTLLDIRTGNAHGPAVIDNVTSAGSAPGFFLKNGQIDQNWPVSVPSGISSFSAWASSHAYSSGNVVSNSGYYIQESAATCTSGGTSPTNLDYGSSIADNTCTWKLVAPTTFDAILLDTGTVNVDIDWSDFTGPYTNGVHLKNSLAGTGPTSVILGDFNTWGNTITADVNAESGSILNIHDGQIQSGVLANHVGIWLQSGFTGNYIINNMTMLTLGNSSAGILDQAGASNGGTIANNRIYNGATGISIGANINNRTITGNHAGSSSLGTNTACIFVSSGTGDYLNIIANDCNGASSTQLTTTGVTGTHNFFQNAGALGVASGGTGNTAGAAQWITSAINVNFAVAGDNAIVVPFPVGYTRLCVLQVAISGASGNISAAKFGLFTASSGGGTAAVTSGTAITVTTAADNTNNNAQAISAANAASGSYLPAAANTMYFNVGTTTTGTANVQLTYRPCP